MEERLKTVTHEAEHAEQQHRPENPQAQSAKPPGRREPCAEHQDEGYIAQQREAGRGEAVIVGEPGKGEGGAVAAPAVRPASEPRSRRARGRWAKRKATARGETDSAPRDRVSAIS